MSAFFVRPSSRAPRDGARPLARPLVRWVASLALAAVALCAVSSVAAAQQRDTTKRDTTKRDTTRAAVPVRAPADTAAAARRDTTRRDTTRATRSPRGPRRAPATTGTIPDSLLRPPISPRRAFLYSLLVPGQGQTSLHRQKAAALFATIELGTIAMIAKSENDLRIARARVRDSVITDSTLQAGGTYKYTKVPDRLVARIRPRRLHVEDWMATLLFNHLFAGADAFVAAQLWDLPTQVSFQPVPRGAAVTVSIPW